MMFSSGTAYAKATETQANNPDATVTTPATTAAPTKTQQDTQTKTATDTTQKFTQQRCGIISSHVKTKVTKYTAVVAKHEGFNAKFTHRIQQLVTKFKAQGYDTAKLEADLLTLKAKAQKFSADRLTYINALKSTQSYACGKSKGEFENELNQARQYLLTLRADRADFQSFYLNTIKPDLLALKIQKTTQTQSATTQQ
jgi:hypothetical protein